MAQRSQRKSRRVVEIAPEADEDLALIYIYSYQHWGKTQAENYDSLLNQAMQQLAVNPTAAPLVPDLPGVRSSTVRWQGTRHGHRIFFRETERGITILRVIHTAMNWRGQLGIVV